MLSTTRYQSSLLWTLTAPQCQPPTTATGCSPLPDINHLSSGLSLHLSANHLQQLLDALHYPISIISPLDSHCTSVPTTYNSYWMLSTTRYQSSLLWTLTAPQCQ